jgi:hypothetical protein
VSSTSFHSYRYQNTHTYTIKRTDNHRLVASHIISKKGSGIRRSDTTKLHKNFGLATHHRWDVCIPQTIYRVRVASLLFDDSSLLVLLQLGCIESASRHESKFSPSRYKERHRSERLFPGARKVLQAGFLPSSLSLPAICTR